jgi:hypothetical protein
VIAITREIGRSERIRTSDPLLPKQVRYQTALRSDRGGGLPRPVMLCKGGQAIGGEICITKHRRARCPWGPDPRKTWTMCPSAA